MLTIIHGADFHLDSPFSGLPPQLAVLRRRQQRELLSRLPQLVAEENADILLLSGDLFDGKEIYRDTIEALTAALAEVRCPVFISPGNHDYYAPQSPYATAKWSDNVHIFPTDSITSVEIPEKNAVIYGAAFLSPHAEQSPLKNFSVTPDGKYHVMTLHGALDGDSYAPISQDMIAQSGLDYLALGHVHQHSGLLKAGDTPYAYPGCPQGRGFDELGDKGVLCVKLEGKSCESEFISLCHSHYEISTLDISSVDNISDFISESLPESTQNDSYRVLLTGTNQSGQPLNLTRLTALLAPRFASLELRDHTRLPQNIWQGLGEDNLRGLFLAEMAALGAEEDESLQLALNYGLAALEQREDIAP